MKSISFENLDDLSLVAGLLPGEGVFCYPSEDGEKHILVVPDVLAPQAEALLGDLPSARKTALAQHARTVSWQKRISGMSFEGILVATDAEGLTLINGLKAMAEDQPERTFSYDTPAGPVPLTAAQAIDLARAVGNFVQSTFDRRAEVLAQIASGDIKTMAQINEAFADL